MSNIAQRNFASGEVSPALYSRTDVSRYREAVRALRNMIVQQDGGALNRPGTQYIGTTKNNGAVRLLKFVLNEVITNTYLIELGALYIRFYQNGARITGDGNAWANATAYTVGTIVTQGGVRYYCLANHTSATATDQPGTGSAWQTVWYAWESTIYEIPVPYSASEISRVQIAQKGNDVYLVHPNHAPRKLTRNGAVWSISAVAFGPSIPAPTNVQAVGGAVGAVQYWAVTAVKNGTFEESLPTKINSIDKVPSADNPTTITWDQVADALSYNVYRGTNEQTLGLIHSSGGSPVQKSDNTWADASETASTAAPDTLATAAGQCRNAIESMSALNRAYDGKYTVKGSVTLTAADVGAGVEGFTRGRLLVYYKRNTDAVRVLVTDYLHPQEIEGPGQILAVAVNIVIEVPDDGYTTLEIDVVPQVESGQGEGTWSMKFDATAIEWYAGASSFVDTGVEPDFNIAPPVSPNILSTEGNYPATVAHYQQRLMFGNSDTNPERIWGSRIGVRESFTVNTPLQPDDSLFFEVDAKQANAVQHMVNLQRLVVFTTATEQVIAGEGEGGTLRPDGVNPRSHSYNGASHLPPLVCNNRILYVQARGNSVRSFKMDDIEGSINLDLSLIASHLFRNRTIVDWDLALSPNSIVWAVRSDGQLLGMTFVPQLNAWGWHRHDTDGLFENVCVIPENSEDAVYFVVNRTINGQTRRYIERMRTRYFDDDADAWFVDCGKAVSGSSAAVGELSHLALKNVSVYGNSQTIASPNNPDYTVRTVAADGSLAWGGTVLTEGVAGLPFTSDVETLDIDSNESTILNFRKLVSRITLSLWRSRRLWASPPDRPPNSNSVTNMQPLQPLTYAGETVHTSITDTREIVPDTDWNCHGRMLLRQVDPVPVGILMIAPEFNIEET